MQDQIGNAAGEIWQALNRYGELQIGELQGKVNAEAPLFHWAIGWLAREHKVIVTASKRSFRIRLREQESASA
ncbi:MAG: winged helix-turn-helix domain-containing protein [Acidobacteriales bacterium]|nr:winged helix-turn-helix domain-containing protein [Terriglobales bacterium]